MSKFIDLDLTPSHLPSACGAFIFAVIITFFVLAVMVQVTIAAFSFLIWEWIGWIDDPLMYRIYLICSVVCGYWFASDVYKGKV